MLFNWQDAEPSLPPEWVNQRPAIVGLDELNSVLSNWQQVALPPITAPEPSVGLLALLGLLACLLVSLSAGDVRDVDFLSPQALLWCGEELPLGCEVLIAPEGASPRFFTLVPTHSKDRLMRVDFGSLAPAQPRVPDLRHGKLGTPKMSENFAIFQANRCRRAISNRVVRPGI